MAALPSSPFLRQRRAKGFSLLLVATTLAIIFLYLFNQLELRDRVPHLPSAVSSDPKPEAESPSEELKPDNPDTPEAAAKEPDIIHEVDSPSTLETSKDPDVTKESDTPDEEETIEEVELPESPEPSEKLSEEILGEQSEEPSEEASEEQPDETSEETSEDTSETSGLLPLDAPSEYQLTPDRGSTCTQRFSEYYLQDFSDHAVSYCSPESSGNITCFHSGNRDDGAVDSMCFGRGIGFDTDVGKFRIECSIRRLEHEELKAGLVPFRQIKEYWYGTGPPQIFEAGVRILPSSKEPAELLHGRSLGRNTANGRQRRDLADYADEYVDENTEDNIDQGVDEHLEEEETSDPVDEKVDEGNDGATDEANIENEAESQIAESVSTSAIVAEPEPKPTSDIASSLEPAPQEPPPRNFLLLKREGEGNLWHCMMEIMSAWMSFDVLQMSRDNSNGGLPFFQAPDDIADTQVVILDDRKDGPYFDLWTLFAKRKPLRLKELAAKPELTAAISDSNIIVPLAGSSNPLWQNDWEASQCASVPTVSVFSQRVVDFYKIPDPAPRTAEDPIRVTFIDRTGSRRLINQTAMFDELLERNPHIALTSIDFGAIPFAEQLRIIRNTDVLVAVHGAGMTHGLFMREYVGAVVEIQPNDVSYYMFRNCALLRGLGYYRVHAESVKPKKLAPRGEWHFEDVKIDSQRFLDVVETAVKSLYGNGAWDQDVN